MNTIYCGIQHRQSNITGVRPSIPAGTYPELSTDLFDGEIFINTYDKLLFFRAGNNIIETSLTLLHNAFTDLQGGLEDEYYHLTEVDYHNVITNELRKSTGVITSDIESTPVEIEQTENYFLKYLVIENLQPVTKLTNVECTYDGVTLFENLTITAATKLVIPITVPHLLNGRQYKVYARGNTDQGVNMTAIYGRFTTI